MIKDHDTIRVLINYIHHILKGIDPLFLTFDPIISKYLINYTPLINLPAILVHLLHLLEVFYPDILEASLLEILHHLHEHFNPLQLL